MSAQGLLQPWVKHKQDGPTLKALLTPPAVRQRFQRWCGEWKFSPGLKQPWAKLANTFGVEFCEQRLFSWRLEQTRVERLVVADFFDGKSEG